MSAAQSRQARRAAERAQIRAELVALRRDVQNLRIDLVQEQRRCDAAEATCEALRMEIRRLNLELVPTPLP